MTVLESVEVILRLFLALVLLVGGWVGVSALVLARRRRREDARSRRELWG